MPRNLWGVAPDPVNRDLLFLGTEFGLWVSLDGGDSWFRWTHGVPTVSVMDLVVHPRDHDLVLGTHGRSAFVLDDISPLRELVGGVPSEPLSLFAIADAQQFSFEPAVEGHRLGAGEYQGENRPYGALITYWLRDESLPHPDEETERARKEAERRARAEEESEESEAEAEIAEADQEHEPPQVEIAIATGEGETIRTFKGPAYQGLNRAVWDFGRDPFKQPPGARPPWRDRGDSGPEVPPGRYTVTVRFDEHEAQGSVRVLGDPRASNSDADWEAREAAIRRAGALQNRLAEAIERIAEVRSDLDVILAKAEPARGR